jgi:hypothetical protein
MVAGTSHDTGKLGDGRWLNFTAGRPGNSESIPWPSDLLAYDTVRKLRLVCPAKLNNCGISYFMRDRCGGRNRDDSRAGERFWRGCPHITTTSASSGKHFGGRTELNTDGRNQIDRRPPRNCEGGPRQVRFRCL